MASGGMICIATDLMIKTGIGLVIGFINRLQIVITINYNTVPDFYTAKQSTLISSVYLHCSSRIYHTGTIQVSLNHTLQISRNTKSLLIIINTALLLFLHIIFYSYTLVLSW
jgi:hypothetical protein